MWCWEQRGALLCFWRRELFFPTCRLPVPLLDDWERDTLVSEYTVIGELSGCVETVLYYVGIPTRLRTDWNAFTDGVLLTIVRGQSARGSGSDKVQEWDVFFGK